MMLAPTVRVRRGELGGANPSRVGSDAGASITGAACLGPRAHHGSWHRAEMIARRAGWSGTLILIAQPAEETISGARAMLQDGLYTRFPKPDYALAFHVAAALPAGRIQVPTAIVSSSADSVTIRVNGVGTHGASPHLGVDPVVVAAQIIVSLQTMVGRDIHPLQGAVISVGMVHGGVKSNIIPEHVDLALTVRADIPEVRLQLLNGIDRVARGTALALGVPENRCRSSPRSPPRPAGDDQPWPDRSERARRDRRAMVEARLIDEPREGMGAEDFAYYVTPESGVRGVYFNVGGTAPDQVGHVAGHHSPLFRILPEPAVTAGVEAMTVAAIALMPRS